MKDTKDDEQQIVISGIVLDSGVTITADTISQQSPTAIVCGLILEIGKIVVINNIPLSEYSFVE